MAAAVASPWKPHESLTKAPTNLKEAIDWVLRVTGKDGKKNVATQSPSTSNGPHCLCYLAKAVKDLLYDAKDPGSPDPSTQRNWDDLLLEQESDIVHPVLTDLGLLSGGSTSAASTTYTCAGGTEVIVTLIDQLALGLQKWVGWQEGDTCCLGQTKGGKSEGIGKGCKRTGSSGGSNCCGKSGPSTTCHDCGKCGTSAKVAANKCYLSAYSKTEALWTTIVNGTKGAGSADLVKAAQDVHLLARTLLGSVCLIWSGLSQLGFLTGGSGNDRWSKEGKLHEETNGLGSFMAAMGYDLERLNQGGNTGNGEFVNGLLADNSKGVPWKEFQGSSTGKGSVAEYYSSIYEKAKTAAKGSSKNTESICKQYPLLVLHILASGYFRAGSAGAKGVITPPPKAPSSDPRKPRTIREILYWLSALPYSQGYRALVERMQEKYPPKEGVPNETVEQIELHGENSGKTDLKKDCVTHYLLAACGYCPLVLIGIQGTIEREVKNTDTAATGQAAAAAGGSAQSNNKKQCPKHKDNPSGERCKYEKDKNKANAQASAAAPDDGKPLEKGQVCYGGYHLAVKDFGPLHGMYANGLFGFQMDLSAAQCLDQLRIYVYHCFYQLYFLRKQCKVGVESGAVLGWQSCRYGSGVSGSSTRDWRCQAGQNNGDHTKNCGIKNSAGSSGDSPLMAFLCDGPGQLVCNKTIGVDPSSGRQNYPEIVEHMNTKDDFPKGHLEDRCKNCPVPMGWEGGNKSSGGNHFKDLNTGSHKQADLEPKGGNNKYPAHCTGNTLSLLLEYYCDPEKCHGTLVVLLRLLACITPTVPRTLGDLFGFYYYIVYIGGKSGKQGVYEKLKGFESEVVLYMGKDNAVVTALTGWNSGNCSAGTQNGTLKCLYKCDNSGNTKQCSQYLSPLSGQQYGQLSPLMAGTYLSWLVYLIEGFQGGLNKLKEEFTKIDCKDSECKGAGGVGGCSNTCHKPTGGNQGVCGCASVVSCTGVLPVLYKYGFGYGNVTELHPDRGTHKKCHNFLGTLESVLKGEHLKKDSNTGLHREINQLIYTTRLPWIFVLTVAWLVAVLYLAFGAIWPLDWTHMRSHCRGWFRKGSLSPWEVLMVGKKKGRGILEFFGGKGVEEVKKDNSTLRTVFLSGAKGWGGG